MSILRWKKVLTGLLTLLKNGLIPIESVKKLSEFERKKEIILDGLESSADAFEVIGKVLLIIEQVTKKEDSIGDYFPNNLLTTFEEEEVAAELEKLKSVYSIMKNYKSIEYVYMKPKRKQSLLNNFCCSE